MREAIVAIAATAAVIAGGAGCKPKATGPLPVCPAMVAADKANEADSRQLPIDVWYSVLIKNFERRTMEVPDEPRECSGRPIEVTWPQELQEDPRAAARRLDPRPRTDADITFAEIEGALLVWARVAELSNGDAIGPVGLVKWIDRGLEIRGIGSVQAPPQRARMRLEDLGEDAQVLVLESELCTGEQKSACVREAQLLPLVEQRFIGAPLVEEGVDTGPTRFLLTDTFEETLKDGWTRKYTLTRKLEFDGGSAVVHENIHTKDCDPKSPSTPCDEQIAAQDKRPLVFEDGKFLTTKSAWKQVEAAHTK